MKQENRVLAVDFLKFIAVLLIINSHADCMYPRMSALATGGAIGDCLFLFVSGFTLFLGQPRQFADFYLRRIKRILPSVIAAGLFIWLMNPDAHRSAIDLAGGEFILALMVYYAILWLIRRYALERLPAVLAFSVLVTLVVYICWFPNKYATGSDGIYGFTTPFRWVPYFSFMLLGAWCGKRSGRVDERPWANFAAMFLCLIAFYGLQVAAKVYPTCAPWQIATLLPLAGVILFLYRWASAPFVARLFAYRVCGPVMLFVGGLCLESYLIQLTLISDRWNALWPANLLLVTALILLCSYAVRCLARFISQVLFGPRFNVSEIFKPF